MADFSNNSYCLDLPSWLKQHGMHDVFHALLLHVHVANDDRLFPECAENQIVDFEDGLVPQEWTINWIQSHQGQGLAAMFEVQWTMGDTTWMSLDQVHHLPAYHTYIEDQQALPLGNSEQPDFDGGDPEITDNGVEGNGLVLHMVHMHFSREHA
jgi:hypothetical protein